MIFALAAVVFAMGKSAPAGEERLAHTLSDEDTARVRDIAMSGQKIAAIKLYRELTGAGLREARDAVEALEQR